jgi:hypothetical protein
MREFVTVLRDRIADVERDLKHAQEAGESHEIDLCTARLRDLLDVAHRQGVDTTGWIDPAVFPTTAED